MSKKSCSRVTDGETRDGNNPKCEEKKCEVGTLRRSQIGLQRLMQEFRPKLKFK